MIDALIGGKLCGQAKEHTSKSGNLFVTAKVRTPMADGESIFVNVICFSQTAAEALLAMSDGDSVALSGSLTPKVWQPANGEARPALDMQAHAVLSAYHVKRKREAMVNEASIPSKQAVARTIAAQAPLPSHGGNYVPDDPL